MDTTMDGMQTHGRKGLAYDWQQLLIPEEPDFQRALDELTTDDQVVAEAR